LLSLKVIAYIAALFIAIIMLLLAVDSVRGNLSVKRAKAVTIGDSKAQVRRVLGRPTGVTMGSYEYWEYGSYVDWENLSSCPIRFRLFGPDNDEVSIRFNDEGKVNAVFIPKQNQR
jgi:outer membrane protein assembly factor BamE (lipoprotein component of BamABCDE complex)